MNCKHNLQYFFISALVGVLVGALATTGVMMRRKKIVRIKSSYNLRISERNKHWFYRWFKQLTFDEYNKQQLDWGDPWDENAERRSWSYSIKEVIKVKEMATLPDAVVLLTSDRAQYLSNWSK